MTGKREDKGIGKEINKGIDKRISKGTDKKLKAGDQKAVKCPHFKKCGGCMYLDLSYEKQLEIKKKEVETLLKPYCRVHSIAGMKDPWHYRNKVHAVMARDKKGKIISGVYMEGTHRVLPVENCLIENEKADAIIGTIRELLPSFKIKVYDEDTGYGFLRHVLVRTAHATGEIMVVLVTASPVFPSKNNFVRALRTEHPEITTIVQNINGRSTSMVLGEKEHVLYGPGFIIDELCGKRFRISSRSFYQVNPVADRGALSDGASCGWAYGEGNGYRCVLWDRHHRHCRRRTGEEGDRRGAEPGCGSGRGFERENEPGRKYPVLLQ